MMHLSNMRKEIVSRQLSRLEDGSHLMVNHSPIREVFIFFIYILVSFASKWPIIKVVYLPRKPQLEVVDYIFNCY